MRTPPSARINPPIPIIVTLAINPAKRAAIPITKRAAPCKSEGERPIDGAL
jgi:hypothetical protein